MRSATLEINVNLTFNGIDFDFFSLKHFTHTLCMSDNQHTGIGSQDRLTHFPASASQVRSGPGI